MEITKSTSAPKSSVVKDTASSGKQRAQRTAAANVAASSGDKIRSNIDRIEFSSVSAKETVSSDKKQMKLACGSTAESGDGERILPERYRPESMAGKMYYQGKLMTQYELLETAVKTGAITLDETKSVGENERCAMEALVYSKASPAYSWSNSLYSEDRKYVFRVENGMITGMRKAYFDDGTDFFDVAKEIASGKMLCDIDPCKLSELSAYDKELFEAACNIGKAKRHYDRMTDCYQNGIINKDQYRHDIEPLLLMLFGKDCDTSSESQLKSADSYFTREDFAANALENYSKENQELFDKLISQKGYHTYSGLF